MKVMKNLSVCLAIATMAACPHRRSHALERMAKTVITVVSGSLWATGRMASSTAPESATTRIQEMSSPAECQCSGSAGTTSLDGHTLNAFEIGVRFQLRSRRESLVTSTWRIWQRATCETTTRMPMTRVRRPTPRSSTQKSALGHGGLAFTYHARNGFSVGVAGEVASFVIDSGWTDTAMTVREQDHEGVPSVGPKVGFRADTIQLEFGVLFGKTISPIAAVQIMF